MGPILFVSMGVWSSRVGIRQLLHTRHYDISGNTSLYATSSIHTRTLHCVRIFPHGFVFRQYLDGLSIVLSPNRNYAVSCPADGIGTGWDARLLRERFIEIVAESTRRLMPAFQGKEF
jgi:hypothetical protein